VRVDVGARTVHDLIQLEAAQLSHRLASLPTP
jgi:hypothetical protein